MPMEDPENLQSNQIKRSTSSWSELPIDPCALILSKLSFANVLRFKAVCPSWNKAVKFVSQSSLSSSFPCLSEPPWILLPQYTDDDGFRFSSVEGKVYSLKNTPYELRHGNSICLGSSQGWLFFFWNKKQLQLLLLNPVSGIQLPLPRFETFPDIISIQYKTQSAERELCTIKFKTSTHAINQIQGTESYNVGSAKDLARQISKVVLCSRPTCSSSNKNIGVLVMYDFTDRWLNVYRNSNYLAFCTTTDRRWRKLAKHRMYIDVTSYDNQFYALRQNYYVEVWDFSKSFLNRKMIIWPDQRAKIPNN
ncbi:hypothetical protein C1H46_028987 [Malus baccata]|uniref:Uncharacterized protein n=1 Tax=Malus baccata TaxID=106549 RepID=A0A540LG69_MALBA|nr:hypothetical protein C1H46_028987 [Malus baccata]